jgi:hypothetical protein
MSRIVLRYMLCAVIVATLITSCRKVTHVPVTTAQQQAKPQLVQDRVVNPEEQSCRAFVQKFYDWYWNQFADKADDPTFDSHKLHGYDDALRLQPPVLSQQLIMLIKKDEKESKEAGGEIVNLDFDPFLNSNGPDGKYLVHEVSIHDGVCQANIEGGHGNHEVAELKKISSTWNIINFHYSYFSEDGKTKLFPDDDLIHILNR